ncbi:MAG: cytochrome P450 [Gammaproteobacteria bacterium]
MSDPSSVDAEEAMAELKRLFLDPALVPDPYPMLDWLRRNDPVIPIHNVKFVTRYADVDSLYRDKRLSRQRAAQNEVRMHHGKAGQDAAADEAGQVFASMLINLDDPAHARVRKILEQAFRPKSVAAWQPRVEAITTALIDKVSGRRDFDFLAELAYPLPEAVICELMGVPLEDHVSWKQWTEIAVGSIRTREPTAEHARAVADVNRKFMDYFRDLVRRRRGSLGEDLVSVLIRAESEGSRLSEMELLGTLQMLITAGHETTANLIGNGMYQLLKYPAQYERLRADPSLVPGAVEEMLRYESPSHWSLPRVATEDIALGDRAVEAGCPVVLAINSANRDPAVFRDPEVFDVCRTENRHIAFAAGPHFCLGSMLARQEAQVMFQAVMTRLPRLELAEEPRWKTTFVRALKGLKVRVAE